MNKILYLKSSVLGDASKTNAVLNALLEVWRTRYPHAEHQVRDLATNPLPHLQGEHLVQPPKEGAKALVELQAADTVVIAAPMYNFSIPSTLKAWFDHVLKANQTFRYTDAGPEGLLKGKRAIVLVSSGGIYSNGPAQSLDFVVPYLKAALGFIGIVDVDVVRVEGVALGEQGIVSLNAALERARAG